MEADQGYRFNYNNDSSKSDVVYSLKLTSAMVQLIETGCSQVSIEFLSPLEGALAIGDKIFKLDLSDRADDVMELYSAHDGQLNHVGKILGRGIGIGTESFIHSLREQSLRAEETRRSGKTVVLDATMIVPKYNQIKAVTISRVGLDNTPKITKASTFPRKTSTATSPIAHSPARIVYAQWLAIRNVPKDLSGRGIYDFFSGLNVASLYACFPVSGDDESLDVYIEFDTMRGAESALLRDGEVIKTWESVQLVTVSPLEASWAKAVGILWVDSTRKNNRRLEFMQQIIPQYFLTLSPVEQADFWEDFASALPSDNQVFPVHDTSPRTFNERKEKRKLAEDRKFQSLAKDRKRVAVSCTDPEETQACRPQQQLANHSSYQLPYGLHGRIGRDIIHTSGDAVVEHENAEWTEIGGASSSSSSSSSSSDGSYISSGCGASNTDIRSYSARDQLCFACNALRSCQARVSIRICRRQTHSMARSSSNEELTSALLTNGGDENGGEFNEFLKTCEEFDSYALDHIGRLRCVYDDLWGVVDRIS